MIPQIGAAVIGPWYLVFGFASWMPHFSNSEHPALRAASHQLLTTDSQVPNTKYQVPQQHLLDHTPLGLLNEAQQHGHVFSLVALGGDFLKRLGGVELGVQQHAKGMMDLLNALFAE